MIVLLISFLLTRKSLGTRIRKKKILNLETADSIKKIQFRILDQGLGPKTGRERFRKVAEIGAVQSRLLKKNIGNKAKLCGVKINQIIKNQIIFQ
jgi:hypothetical protein